MMRDMAEKLSIKEIEKRYDQQWVLIVNPEHDGKDLVKAGVVLAHSRNRDVVYRRAMKLKPPRKIAVFWMGELPFEAAAL